MTTEYLAQLWRELLAATAFAQQNVEQKSERHGVAVFASGARRYFHQLERADKNHEGWFEEQVERGTQQICAIVEYARLDALANRGLQSKQAHHKGAATANAQKRPEEVARIRETRRLCKELSKTIPEAHGAGHSGCREDARR